MARKSFFSMNRLDSVVRKLAIAGVVIYLVSFGLGAYVDKVMPSPTKTEIVVPTGTPTQTPTPRPTRKGTATNAMLEITPRPETACLPGNAKISTGEVTRIINGYTIEIQMGKERYRVRYIGAALPGGTVPGKPFNPTITAKNDDLVSGTKVTLVKDASEIDEYGSLFRYVLVGNVFINYEMIAQGYAVYSNDTTNLACRKIFEEAEALARQNRAGLWASTPTAVK